MIVFTEKNVHYFFGATIGMHAKVVFSGKMSQRGFTAPCSLARDLEMGVVQHFAQPMGSSLYLKGIAEKTCA